MPPSQREMSPQAATVRIPHAQRHPCNLRPTAAPRAGTPAAGDGRPVGSETSRAPPDMQEKIMRIGLIPHDTPSVEGDQRYIKAETEKWGTLVRQLGLEGSQ
jgi:hypothetical protein